MIKPVVLDFEYNVQSTQNIKNNVPELSFSSILKDAMQNTSEATDPECNQTDDTVNHYSNSATVQVKDTKEKDYDRVQDKSKNGERTFADRRNEQNNEVYVEKQDVMQSLAGSALHTNNNRAIVTDKNALTEKHSVYKKDSYRTLKLHTINNNKEQKLFANETI
ncbi:MAG TPA: hypothetical protein PK348_00215, partial [Spirochaetota bacterium]|nr:hypothetical protein [Spirochaetota bacterium]